MYYYAYNCITPESAEELDFIQQNFETIDVDTFKRAVGKTAFKEAVNSLNTYSDNFPIEEDWGVEYRMSKTGHNEVIYYLVQSSFEHVFKKYEQ